MQNLVHGCLIEEWLEAVVLQTKHFKLQQIHTEVKNRRAEKVAHMVSVVFRVPCYELCRLTSRVLSWGGLLLFRF